MRKYQLAAFVIGSSLAGLSGVLYTTWGQYITPSSMGITAAALPIVWVAVGGRSDLTATLLGTILLIGGFQALTVYGSQYALVVMGAAARGHRAARAGRAHHGARVAAAAAVSAPRSGDGVMALLETRKLNKRFGGLQVTADVDFVLEPGELHCLIGPNGAGKSTLFRSDPWRISADERPDFLRRQRHHAA